MTTYQSSICKFNILRNSRQYSDLSKLKDLLSHKEVKRLDEKEVVDGVVPRSPELKITNYMENLILDIPPNYRNRTARIYQRSKNVMQQGTDNTKTWILDFNTQERWENPNMGWSSRILEAENDTHAHAEVKTYVNVRILKLPCHSGDSLSNIELHFPSLCSAECYAERQGLKWFSKKPHVIKEVKKSYAELFPWNKRTRVSTK